MTAIVWFRRDLRLHDHAALHKAVQTDEDIVPVCILEDRFCRSETVGDRRLHAFLSAVSALGKNLEHVGSRLIIRHGEPLQVLEQLIQETGADKLFYNRDYSPFARSRDEQVEMALRSKGVFVQACKDLVLHEPGEIMNKQGKAYAVFTPFRRVWQTLPKDRLYPMAEKLPAWDGITELFSEKAPVVEQFGRKKPLGSNGSLRFLGKKQRGNG